jgi:hypothetical protein
MLIQKIYSAQSILPVWKAWIEISVDIITIKEGYKRVISATVKIRSSLTTVCRVNISIEELLLQLTTHNKWGKQEQISSQQTKMNQNSKILVERAYFFFKPIITSKHFSLKVSYIWLQSFFFSSQEIYQVWWQTVNHQYGCSILNYQLLLPTAQDETVPQGTIPSSVPHLYNLCQAYFKFLSVWIFRYCFPQTRAN